jgi:uncharacterized protein (TIGR03118 family)
MQTASSVFRPRLEELEDRRLLSGPEGLFQQTDLAADRPGIAVVTDPALVNAWGIALGPTGGAFWVSDERTGVTTLYTGDVNGSAFAKAGLTVTLPGGRPTGQVFNGTPDFKLSPTGPAAIFIFASAAGHITAWNPAVPPATLAVAKVSTPGQSNWTGLARANNGTANFLYAADFKNGEIDVFDANFAPATLTGTFHDPGVPDRFAPFNVQNLNGELYVTYAREDRSGDGLPDGGSGFVSVFDADGNFKRRLAARGPLDQPWGLALAPADFGDFGGAVLVGNHGDGRIHAFDPATGERLGQMREPNGRPLQIDGLWGLAFGNGVSAGDRNALYFAAGPDDGAHGLFGSLRPAEDDDRGGFRERLRELLGQIFDKLKDFLDEHLPSATAQFAAAPGGAGTEGSAGSLIELAPPAGSASPITPAGDPSEVPTLFGVDLRLSNGSD